MVNIDSMLYQRDLFIAQLPELALRYPECATVDHVLYVHQESCSKHVTLPSYVQSICIIIGASTAVLVHQSISFCVHLIIHLEPYAQLRLIQSLVHSDGKRQLDVRCFGQASSSFILSGWYTQAITANIGLYLQEKYSQARVTLGVHMQQAWSATFTTMQHHQAPGTTSSLQFKGLVQDDARCVHSGTIHIDALAQQADAGLHSNFLLLGSSAQAYAQPILQVLNNQVRCAHGSAIGSCDDEQLFYLCSRGVGHDAAKQLLSDAFLADVKQVA